jgi:F0F1-type ATP synthase gamma subunit
MSTVYEITGQVNTREEAEQVVAQLLNEWVGDNAYNKLLERATREKKSREETLRRAVSNLFRTFSTNKTK